MTNSEKIIEIRKKTGMNRRAFCEKTGIPYMTMTDWERGTHSAPDYVVKLLEHYTEPEETNVFTELSPNDLCSKWSEQKNYRCNFPIVKPHEKVEVEHIYPTKQALAVAVYEALIKDKAVTGLVLFGSSVTMKCTKDSDMDFCVELAEDTQEARSRVSETIQNICSWNADVLWQSSVKEGSQIYRNVKKGVRLI